MALGSARMTMARAEPPNGGGADTPGMAANLGCSRLSAWSWIWHTVLGSLDRTRYPTGTLPVSNRMMNGGTVPGGMNALLRFTYPTVSAMAWAMSVPGWKYSFMSETPWTFRLSTWWMPPM